MSWESRQKGLSKLLSSYHEESFDRSSVPSGLRIYANSSFEIQINSLMQNFPLTEKILGEKNFRACARDFLNSSSQKLKNLDIMGMNFSDFVRANIDTEDFPYTWEVSLFDWYFCCVLL